MFEDEYAGRDDRELPGMFYVIADVTPGVTAEDIRDAVLAAWEAAPMGVAVENEAEQITNMYRTMLRPIVSGFADANGLDADEVCDALVTCAQTSDAVEQERKEREEAEQKKQQRRERRTT